MSHTRIRVAAAMVLSTALIACGEDPASRIAGVGTPDDKGRQFAYNERCNGVDGSQFKVSATGGSKRSKPNGGPAFGEVPQRLQQVIVYGNPVQLPSRGYGAVGSYGGVTQTYIYDRNILDECTFGTGFTFGEVQPVADDTLDSPEVAPDSIPQDVWKTLPPRVRKQLREAAWYLADHWVPNDLPEIGSLIKEARRALIFQVLVKGYNRAEELRSDRRVETASWAYTYNSRYRGLSNSETLRVDALIMGCLTAESFRERLSWTGQQAGEWASRVTAAWASDATQDYELRYLEPQLSMLGAIGAQFGREGDSCGSVARYHFENRPTDLIDPPQGAGGENPRQF